MKDFDKDIKIYKLKDRKKCFVENTDGDSLLLNIVAYDEKSGDTYVNGDISTNNIGFFVYSNLLDSSNCIYYWYRNGRKIETKYVSNYLINKDSEDAEYYAEMILPNGKKVKSKTIHVIIKK